jgi:multidrug efflux pump subunit AcrA (membrane-fusion protein)
MKSFTRAVRPRSQQAARLARLAALALLLITLLVACTKAAGEATRYHCPMHPTYVSDRQGDCPICGMRLVPINERGATAGGRAHDHDAPVAGKAGASQAAWVCPMHCEGSDSGQPGRCPKCGMALVPNPDLAPQAAPAAPAAPPAGLAPVELGHEQLALAGVQTAAATRGRLERSVRTVGTVVVDETRIRHVHTKIAGWVDKLQVDFTGSVVKKGQPLLTIYSQELLASQEEYLRAREAAGRFAQSSLPEVRRGGQELLEAARRRLALFDVPPGFLAAIERSGKPQRAVPVLAPSSGIVTAKGVFEGQQVEPSMELFTLTDLSHVWIEAAVYENEAALVRVGQQATLTLAFDASVRLQGQVSFVAPTLDPDTRTLTVRFAFDNPDSRLKPGMFANVELPLAAEEGVLVPDSAILDTGLRQVAFVRGQGGRFEPREVKVGLRSGGQAQVLTGVAEGEQVAVRANFLLDSESRLRDAIGGGHVH